MKTKLIYQATNQEVQVGDLTTIVGSSIRVKVEAINFDLMTVELSGSEEDHECRDVPFRRAYAPEKIGARFATTVRKTASVGWTEPVARHLAAQIQEFRVNGKLEVTFQDDQLYADQREADHALLAELGVPGHASTEQFARSMGHARAGFTPEQGSQAFQAQAEAAVDISTAFLKAAQVGHDPVLQLQMAVFCKGQLGEPFADQKHLLVSNTEFTIILDALEAFAERGEDERLAVLLERIRP